MRAGDQKHIILLEWPNTKLFVALSTTVWFILKVSFSLLVYHHGAATTLLAASLAG